MKDEDLDIAYSEFCATMTGVGKDKAELFLARFALLSMIAIGDLDHVRKLIADAAAIGVSTTQEV
jgi:hypothetical protein